MKKFLKWSAIILGIVLLLITGLLITIMVKYDFYGFYHTGGPLSYNQQKFDITWYNINLAIHPDDQSIDGYTEVKLRSEVKELKQVHLNLIDNFDVNKIVLNNGREINFEHEDDTLFCFLPEPVREDEIISLTVYYGGRPVEAIMPPWIGGVNWSKDSTGADWVGISCQGAGAKIWFPCKDQPSDEPDSAAMNFTVPEQYYCASNGLLTDITNEKPGYKTFHWKTSYPINNYDITFNIGRFRRLRSDYVTLKGDTMPVYYYVLPESAADKANTLLSMAVDMLYTYRKYYGEYPWTREKFAIVQTAYLGMEHQTINSYGNRYRFKKLHNGKEFDWLMLHEMGHEWWGNKITAKYAADMWLQEGICTYGEALFTEDKAGEKGYHNRIATFRKAVKNTAPVVPERDATSNDVYSGDIYFKGAYLMHSLRFILGDSLFLHTLKSFATDSGFSYGFATTDDFIKYFSASNPENIIPFIRMMLYTTDYPVFEVDKVKEGEYGIRLTNTDFELPVEIEANGQLINLLINQNRQIIECDSMPAIDPKNWYLKKTVSPEK